MCVEGREVDGGRKSKEDRTPRPSEFSSGKRAWGSLDNSRPRPEQPQPQPVLQQAAEGEKREEMTKVVMGDGGRKRDGDGEEDGERTTSGKQVEEKLRGGRWVGCVHQPGGERAKRKNG